MYNHSLKHEKGARLLQQGVFSYCKIRRIEIKNLIKKGEGNGVLGNHSRCSYGIIGVDIKGLKELMLSRERHCDKNNIT